ncbi:MAG: NmrA family transcriptional regulator, partial [Ketobacter sp.]
MSTPTTLIIGKNAKTGSRVDALLTRMGHPTRAVSRSTTPAFDWEDPTGWAQAMAGCRAAYVTFQPDLAVPGARETIARFIATARQAGIEHLVLLSGRGEAGAQQAEQELMNSGLTWNVVRASWFNQNFSEGFLIEGILAGEVA